MTYDRLVGPLQRSGSSKDRVLKKKEIQKNEDVKHLMEDALLNLLNVTLHDLQNLYKSE